MALFKERRRNLEREQLERDQDAANNIRKRVDTLDTLEDYYDPMTHAIDAAKLQEGYERKSVRDLRLAN